MKGFFDIDTILMEEELVASAEARRREESV